MKGFWVEILKVGRWIDAHGNPFNIDQNDLESIHASHKETYPDVEPVLRLGDHPGFGEGLKPAVGFAPETKVEGDTLLAKFTDVPEIVLGAFTAKRYKKVSAGLWRNFRHKGKTHPFVLNHIAILGAELPAIKGLEDLQAYMSDGVPSMVPADVHCLTHERKKEKEVMTELEKKLTAELEKAQGENKTLTKANEGLGVDLSAAKVSNDGLKAEVAEFNDKNIQVEVETVVDAAIKDKRLLPANKDKAMKAGIALRSASVDLKDGDDSPYNGWKDTLASGGEVIDLKAKGKTGEEGAPDDMDAQIKAGAEATERVFGKATK